MKGVVAEFGTIVRAQKSKSTDNFTLCMLFPGKKKTVFCQLIVSSVSIVAETKIQFSVYIPPLPDTSDELVHRRQLDLLTWRNFIRSITISFLKETRRHY